MMWYFSRARRLRSMATFSMLAALTLASAATAQQFRTDPVDDRARALGRNGQIWVRDRAAYAAGEAQFNEYFTKFYFPAMTRNTPSGLADVGKLRVDLFKKYLWGTSNEQLQANLTDLAFKAMMRIVGNQQAPPYHPAVRYNAILVIGLLDDQYAIDSGAGARPPKPHANANRAIVQIVNRAATDTRFPPPVVLGAIVGLERHAKYSAALPPDQVTAMSAALLKLVNNDKPIQDMNPEAYSWLRLRAASALANLGKPGDNNAVHDAIIKLVGSLKSFDDRCAAAALLAKLDYKDAKIDGPAATKALFKLAGELSADELKRALDFEKMQSLGGFTGGRGAMLESNDPNAQDDGFPREHVLARLHNLRRGLRAVKPAVPAESQKEIDDVLAAIQPVIAATADKSLVSIEISNAISTMNSRLVQLVGAPEGAEDEEFSVGGEAAADATPVDGAAVAAPAPADGAPAAETPAAQTPPAEAPAAPAADTPPAAPTN
jgi:hypothetical protein